MITVLCGGVGAARFLTGLVEVVDPGTITAIVNTADDTELHGLYISPDLDTVTYTLAGAVNPETGWGLVGETFAAMDALDAYGVPTWFRLGDRDLATHLFRTARLDAGATLAEVASEIAARWKLAITVVPMSNDRVRTRLELLDGGEVEFQEYFVRLRHGVAVSSVRFVGATQASPAPGVLDALDAADVIVVAPSNPIVSIGPILAIPAIAGALAARREDVIAISPIVAGAALKGPADRLLVELGLPSSVVGVARVLAPHVATLVVDNADAALVDAVEAEGVRCVVAPTVMASPELARGLAASVLGAARR